MVRFTWDEKKRRNILVDRGFDLLRAIRIFRGPIIMKEDTRHEYGETRYVALGAHEGEHFYVVYTPRKDQATGEDVFHVITAWRAGQRGKRRYQERFS